MPALAIRFVSGAAAPRMRLIDAMTDGNLAATGGRAATKLSSRYLLHVTFMTKPRQGADRPAPTRGVIAAGDSICHRSANCSPRSSHKVETSSRLPFVVGAATKRAPLLQRCASPERCTAKG